ncbi:MAG TPA: HAD-IIIA family hydrolase [Roseateles sp.]
MTLLAGGSLRGRRPFQDDVPLPAHQAPPQRRAVFIDRDGTLIDNLPHNTDPARLHLKPGAPEALAALAAQGWALLVVTNQSGLARGYFTRQQFARLQAALEQRLRDAAGVELLDFLVCPHAPAPDGSPACLCRKPAPGLLLRAARCHGIDLARSWMLGDTLDDVEAGHRAGCQSLLLGDGDPLPSRRTPLRQPEAKCRGWADAARHLLLMSDEPAALST